MSESKTTAVRSKEVAERLRHDILTGRISEGARITEAELSKRFGVGRGPVREAVQRLSLQGLLDTRPNCGAVVSSEAPKEVLAVTLPIRRTLEIFALKELFHQFTSSDFERWEAILEEMRKACEAVDLHAIAENDIAFHRYLLERLGQPDLLAIWDLLVGRMRSHFRRTQRRRCKNMMEIFNEHRAILDSFKADSLDDAARLLKEKIE